MKSHHLLFCSLTCFALMACNQNSRPAPSTGNCSFAGEVFTNTVCPTWRSTSIYEQNKHDIRHAAVFENGAPGVLVTHRVLDSGDPQRQKIIDIRYNDNPDYNALVEMTNLASQPNGVDLSDYAAGQLVFDLNVISKGDNDAPISVKIGCFWPCQSEIQTINVAATQQWTTIKIPVESLITSGLDIKRVSTGFLISPEWGKQTNAHFQIDNIRWEKALSAIR